MVVSALSSYTHTHTTVLLLFWNMSGTTWVSRYQKGKTRQVKTNLDLLEQEIVSGSGICWAICKVYTSSQTTTPTSHHSVFYRPDALPAAQPTASKHRGNWLSRFILKIAIKWRWWKTENMQSKLGDWLIELMFDVSLFPANLMASTKKTQSNLTEIQ